MKQNPSWKTPSRSANQESLRILWNPKFYCRVHKKSPPVSILSQTNPVHVLPLNLFKRSILILSSYLRLDLPSSLLPAGLLPRPCMHFCLHPYILHALPKSLSLIWSPESYLVKSTDREVSQCAVFSGLLLLSLSNVFLSTLLSKTLSLCSSFSTREQVSPIPKKKCGPIRPAMCCFSISVSLYRWDVTSFCV